MRQWMAMLVLATLLAGCGLGPGPSHRGAVSLRVTRDFGQRRLSTAPVDSLRSSDTVLRLLESRRKVVTTYGGGFVQAIDGLAGARTTRHDWFYYVNGREGDVGAADYSLSPGDVIQWDHHRWDATMHIPSIVGAFPEPFVHGVKGKRLPTRVECENDRSAACTEVRRRLADQGVIATGAQLGSVTGKDTLRVVVARWAAARNVGTIGTLAGGPQASGVFVRFDRDLELLDGAGGRVMRAPAGSGLVAATARPGGATEWLVTGLDDAGVARAAGALVPARLRDAFAVAVTPGGDLRLPLASGAR